MFFSALYRKIKGSMTVEAALTMPWFLFAMITMMQFAAVQISASSLLAGMHETAKEMAVYAYVQDIGISAGESLGGEFIAGGLSAAYAKGSIEGKASSAVKNGSFHLLQSSFLTNEMIDIVGTYEPARTFTLLPAAKTKTILRTRVRAWTGREGRKSKGTGDAASETEEEDSEKVYVAETGKVYHKDPNCTHIKLKINSVSLDSIPGRRNQNGAKYHACEKCGGSAGGTVYISPQGDAYHSSAACSGLKRTVHECSMSEVDGMRACSRCGGG